MLTAVSASCNPTHKAYESESATRVGNLFQILFGSHTLLAYPVQSMLAANYLRHIRKVREHSPGNKILKFVINTAKDSGIDARALTEMGDELEAKFPRMNSPQLSLAEREAIYGSTVNETLIQIVGKLSQLSNVVR